MQKLIINNLSVGYGIKTIIDTFFLELTEPTFVAIIGLNGCGKSSFLKAISRKVDFTGEVKGVDYFSYLGQKNQVSFNISTKDLLLMGRFKHKHFSENYSSKDEKIALGALKNLNIEHLWDRPYHELSGGEQQLIWIIQSILQDEPILLLDEPTQQLDIKNKKKVFDALSNLVLKENKIVFCVTHDLNNLSNMEGYLLNFSKNNPGLELISSSTISENITYLENL